MRRSSSQRGARRRARPVARWLCLLLCLATWRGPVPWVHAHAADCDLDSAAVGDELVRHLADYHHGPDELGGWHFHWLHLCDCGPDGESDAPSSKPSDPLLTFGVPICVPLDLRCGDGQAQNALAQVLSLHVALPAPVTPTPGEVRLILPSAPRSFATSLLAVAPLRAVTGVALC